MKYPPFEKIKDVGGANVAVLVEIERITPGLSSTMHCPYCGTKVRPHPTATYKNKKSGRITSAYSHFEHLDIKNSEAVNCPKNHEINKETEGLLVAHVVIPKTMIRYFMCDTG